MLVDEIMRGQYRLNISDDELEHFMFLVVSSENSHIGTVSELFNYILTYCEQHWCETLKEPEIHGH